MHGAKIGARPQRLNKAPESSSIRRLPHAVEKRRGGQPVRADDHSLKHFDCLVNPTRLGARFHRPEYLSGPQFAAGRTPTHHRVWHAPAYSSSPEATILVRLPRVATSAILRRAFSRTPCSMHTQRDRSNGRHSPSVIEVPHRLPDRVRAKGHLRFTVTEAGTGVNLRQV